MTSATSKPGLINVALHKPASQSSLSEWSDPDEAARAVNGEFRHFAFHTDIEEAPWWQVDLGQLYTLEAIFVHNRLDGWTERARKIKIEVSEDGSSWTVIHSGLIHFGGHGSGEPLRLELNGLVRARYVSTSLEERQCLHLSQIEVYVNPETIAFDRYVSKFNLQNLFLQSQDSTKSYALERATACDNWDSIVGLKINYSGRFGNLFQQYTHAILLAKRTSLNVIQLAHHELFDIHEQCVEDGITYIPMADDLPSSGAFLSGIFFDSTDFEPILSPFLVFEPQDEIDHSEVAQNVLRKHLLTNVPFHLSDHFDDELVIHMRSGDIFVGDEPVSSWYRQPPLSFYQHVIHKMRAEGRINRTRLVYEDEGNPCIAALRDWLRAEDVPFRIQSGSLAEDLAVLIDAPHLVFGHGTFGYAVCRLSRHIQTLHFFSPELGGRYEYMPQIAEVYQIDDAEGDYIKGGVWGGPEPGEWHNTPEQRALMISYPISKLAEMQVKPTVVGGDIELGATSLKDTQIKLEEGPQNHRH